MEQKAITVSAKYEGNIESVSISKSLLHSAADALAVVFRFDDRDRDIRFVYQQYVDKLADTTSGLFTANYYPTVGKVILFADMMNDIPTRRLDGRHDELSTNVAFGKRELLGRSQTSEPLGSRAKLPGTTSRLPANYRNQSVYTGIKRFCLLTCASGY